jgi:hypothetical protein
MPVHTREIGNRICGLHWDRTTVMLDHSIGWMIDCRKFCAMLNRKKDFHVL